VKLNSLFVLRLGKTIESLSKKRKQNLQFVNKETLDL
jgi:hypothetical protein